MGTLPAPQNRTHITTRNAVWHLAAAATAIALLAVHPIATLAFGAAFLWPMAADWVCSRWSPWVVYMLRDGDHECIYVGQTDDPMRRMYQHTDGREHTWWRDIHGYTIWRHCASERQARRIERRLIGVVNKAASNNWSVDKLRNEIYGEDHNKPGRRLPVSVWYPFYLLGSALWDSRSFHAACTLSRSIPQRPNSDPQPDDSDLSEPSDDSTSRTGNDTVEATYERRTNGHQPSTPPTLGLPAAPCHTDEPVTARHSRTDPYGVRQDDPLSHPRRRDTSQPTTPAGDSIREAHRRQQQATITALPGDLADYLTDEEAEALPGMDADSVRTLRDRLRQRKSRANRAAAAEQSPTYTARPRPDRGGGAGGRG